MAKNKFLAAKACANSDCLQKNFQPARRDQKFCSASCKDYFHNNRKRELFQKEYFREKVIKLNERQLASIYNSPVYPAHEVPENILSFMRVIINICSDFNINKKTNQTVFWSHRYGVEIIPGKTPTTYSIHKR